MVDTMDRTSELPTSIIHHIMSYLHVKDVTRTSVLSKRWNCLKKSFPSLDFDQRNFKSFKHLKKFVDLSLNQFCEFNLSMQKFRLSLILFHVNQESSSSIMEWIRLATEKGVKELELDFYFMILYTLPQIIFSAKSVTALKITSCKLQQPSYAVCFRSLKKLTLVSVCIYEQMIQNLASECPLLEDLSFTSCWGLEVLCLCKPLKLKILNISTKVYDVERVEIDVPSLQQLTLCLRKTVIDLAESTNLTYLNLLGSSFTEQEFHYLISKFPLLENLSVSGCYLLQRVSISSNRLKKLDIDNCSSLTRLAIDTPNLLSFSFLNNLIPISKINAPCPWNVCFLKEDDCSLWYVHEIKEFVGVFNRIQDLTLCFASKNSCRLNEFRSCAGSPPCEVENLSIYVDAPDPSNYAALLNGVLSICYPKTLTVGSKDPSNKFIKWLYKQLKGRDRCRSSSWHPEKAKNHVAGYKYEHPKCCYQMCVHRNHIKCWRHYLKDVKLGKDKKQHITNSWMGSWPTHLQGTWQACRFHLYW